MLIRSPLANTSGSAYIIFGNQNVSEIPSSLSSLNGKNGVGFITSANEGIGAYGQGNVDVNGDGLSDVVLGTTTGGKAYVVFGKEKGYSSGSVDVSQMKEIGDGFIVDVEASVPVPVAALDVSVCCVCVCVCAHAWLLSLRWT
jgi:hypothetical protein